MIPKQAQTKPQPKLQIQVGSNKGASHSKQSQNKNIQPNNKESNVMQQKQKGSKHGTNSKSPKAGTKQNQTISLAKPKQGKGQAKREVQLKLQIKQKQIKQREKPSTSTDPTTEAKSQVKRQMKKQQAGHILKGSSNVVFQLDLSTLASADPHIMIVGTLEQYEIDDPAIIDLYSKPIANKFLRHPISATHSTKTQPIPKKSISNQLKHKHKQKQKQSVPKQQASQVTKQVQPIIENSTDAKPQLKQQPTNKNQQLIQTKKQQTGYAQQQLHKDAQPKQEQKQKQDKQQTKTQRKQLSVPQNTKQIQKQVQQRKDVFAAIFTGERMEKLQEKEIRIQNEYIDAWILQIFYSLHPRSTGTGVYYKIEKSNVYVDGSPNLQQIFKREDQFIWENPFRVLIRQTVANQAEYLRQLTKFDSQFASIKCFDDLELQHNSSKMGKHHKEYLTVQNMAMKIKHELSQTKSAKQAKGDIGNSPLNQQLLKWITVETGMDSKCKPYIYCRASKLKYDPHKFWSAVCPVSKHDDPHQLFVIEIEDPKLNSRLVGFYTAVVPTSADLSKQPLIQYIPDKDKKSLLLNISMKTVHRLADEQHALAYNNKILLCIGKCDIIISAYAISNLCYFPVSYKPDGDQLCSKDGQLCGSKKFAIKQVYVYRFQKKA